MRDDGDAGEETARRANTGYALPGAIWATHEPPAYRWISRVLCGFAVLCWAALGLWIPYDRQRYINLFNDFHLKLPGVTQLVTEVPTAVIWTTVAAVIIGLITTQWGSRSKQMAIVLHLLGLFGSGVAFVLYREAMQLAIWNLMTGMTQMSGGGRP